MTERHENGQEAQPERCRPGMPRPTAGGGPSSCSDSAAACAAAPGFATLTPTSRSRPERRHRTVTVLTATGGNGLANGSTVRETQTRGTTVHRSTNSPMATGGTATAGTGSERRTAREEKERDGGGRSAWELAELIRALPMRRGLAAGEGKQRPLSRAAPAIVEYVYQSRFVVAGQVQRRFGEWIRTLRTAQYQLTNLVRQGLLATAPVRSTSPNFPFVYYCTKRGVGLVNETYAGLGSRVQYPVGEECKRRGLALVSILHEVLLSEFELTVRHEVEERSDLNLLATERRYYRPERQLRFDDNERLRSVVPDAGFLWAWGEGNRGTSQNTTGQGMWNLVEFDNGSMPASRVAEKLGRYGDWVESDAGERWLQSAYGRFGLTPPSSGFRLLLVAHDPWHAGRDARRLAALLSVVLSLPAAMRDRVWLTTVEALREAEVLSPPPDRKIWVRGRDCRAWMAAHQSLQVQKQNTLQRQFIYQQLPLLPRHRLLPSPATTLEAESRYALARG